MSSADASRPTNRLAEEKSPYLLQHAHNPVQWHAWSAEALHLARAKRKPIFLSIGYSTCHWCHVMERESFESEEIAALMNESFVCIKVDREERPDLDEIYMASVQAMTGQGGWPLSVWLTPELEPFYGGTYFPPDDRFGRPGFPRVLRALRDLWREKPDDVREQARKLRENLAQLGELPASEGELDRGIVDRAHEQLVAAFEPRHGGWGHAPKFPRSDFGRLALRRYARTGEPQALEMATQTLDAMARGGIFDHLGGGFARYSTDERWLVPHFEKMLYDNAQLALHYVEAYQCTGREEYARVVRATLDYVLRDMTHPDGGFYSAEDADSEGEEGRFYVWTLAEVDRALEPSERDLVVEHFGLTVEGNWEGRNVLEIVVGVEELARRRGVDEDDLRSRLDAAKAKLFALREKRVRPGLDDKVLTAWNGLMIGAMARAGAVLDEARYREAARRAADFVHRELRDAHGRLLRRWRDGEARFEAFAEDYAFLVAGLLELGQATLDLEPLRRARRLHDELFALFGDGEGGALFHTRAGRDDLIVRARSGYDGSVPTANSVAAANALLLHELTGEEAYARQAESILGAFAGVLSRAPLAMASLVAALDAWLSPRTEVVIAARDDAEARIWARALWARYVPDLVVARLPHPDESADLLGFPLLQDRSAPFEATQAYVCRGFACAAPSRSVEEMIAALEG